MCWRRPSTYPTKSMASFCSELTLYVPTHIVGAYRGVSAIEGSATLVSTSHAAAKPSTWSQALISTALAWCRCSSV
jgi:hypothetical protein